MAVDNLQFTPEERASLGAHTEDVAKAPEPEAPPAEPPATPAPAEPAESEAEETMTLAELDERFNKVLDERLKPPAATPAANEDDPDAEFLRDAPPEVVKLHTDNKALEAKVAALEQKDAEREEALATQTLEHSIKSTVGKLKMTAAELNGTVVYLESNPNLHATLGKPGGITFEEAAMQRYPGIEARAKAPAPVPSDGGELSSPPSANGSGAPRPFVPTYTGPGDYRELTKHLLRSGEAAGIGKYT